MKCASITERCAQLLGPDLLVWRSQYFYKGPKSPAIQWHQASTFMVEDYQDPGIFPPDRSEVFQLTVWHLIEKMSYIGSSPNMAWYRPERKPPAARWRSSWTVI